MTSPEEVEHMCEECGFRKARVHAIKKVQGRYCSHRCYTRAWNKSYKERFGINYTTQIMRDKKEGD